MVGLDDLKGLFQPMILRFYDSIWLQNIHVKHSLCRVQGNLFRVIRLGIA